MLKDQQFRLKKSESATFTISTFFLLAIGMAAMLYLFFQLLEGNLETEHKVSFGFLLLMMGSVLYQQFGGGSKDQMTGNVYLKETHYQHNAQKFDWQELCLTEYRGERDYLLLYTLSDSKHRYWLLSAKDDHLLKALQQRPLQRRVFTECRRATVSMEEGIYQIQAPNDNRYLSYNLNNGKHVTGSLEGEDANNYAPEFYVADAKVV